MRDEERYLSGRQSQFNLYGTSGDEGVLTDGVWPLAGWTDFTPLSSVAMIS